MTRSPERSLGWPGRVALGGLVVLGAVLATTDWITLILYGSYAVVAAVLVVRRPKNVIGWILLANAWSLLGTSVVQYVDADVATILAGHASSRDAFLLWINGWAGALSYVCYRRADDPLPVRIPARRALATPGDRRARGRRRRRAGHGLRPDDRLQPRCRGVELCPREPLRRPAGPADLGPRPEPWRPDPDRRRIGGHRRRVDDRALHPIDRRAPPPAPMAGGRARIRRPGDRLRLRHPAPAGKRRWLRLAPGPLRLSLRPTRHRDRHPALPPVRDRPDHQPHAQLRRGDRHAGGRLRGRCARASGRPRPIDGRQHRCRGGLDAHRGRALPAASPPDPAHRRPPLRPGALRRADDRRRLRSPTA